MCVGEGGRRGGHTVECAGMAQLEFVPGPFLYNGRVGLLLAPCWLVMLMYGGKTTSGKEELLARPFATHW